MPVREDAVRHDMDWGRAVEPGLSVDPAPLVEPARARPRIDVHAEHVLLGGAEVDARRVVEPHGKTRVATAHANATALAGRVAHAAGVLAHLFAVEPDLRGAEDALEVDPDRRALPLLREHEVLAVNPFLARKVALPSATLRACRPLVARDILAVHALDDVVVGQVEKLPVAVIKRRRRGRDKRRRAWPGERRVSRRGLGAWRRGRLAVAHATGPIAAAAGPGFHMPKAAPASLVRGPVRIELPGEALFFPEGAALLRARCRRLALASA